MLGTPTVQTGMCRKGPYRRVGVPNIWTFSGHEIWILLSRTRLLDGIPRVASESSASGAGLFRGHSLRWDSRLAWPKSMQARPPASTARCLPLRLAPWRRQGSTSTVGLRVRLSCSWRKSAMPGRAVSPLCREARPRSRNEVGRPKKRTVHVHLQTPGDCAACRSGSSTRASPTPNASG